QPRQRRYFEQTPFAVNANNNTGREAPGGQTVHNTDARADPKYPFGGPQVDPYRTVLAIPMLKADDLLGVILIYRHEVLPFTDSQIALMETFADQAVIAIENARLFDEVQARTRELTESLEQQTATSEALGVISSAPGELEPVFQTMLANAVRICEASFGNLLLYDGDAFRHVALHNAPQAWAAEQQRDPIAPRSSARFLYGVADTKQIG